MGCSRHQASRHVLALGLLLSLVVTRAAEQNLIYTMGTSANVGGTSRVTYLVFESEDTELLRGRELAIYRKAGDASAFGNYQRVAVVGIQLAPRTIKALLARSVALGEDLADLDKRLSGMYGSLIPAVDLPREERLRLVLLAARNDADTYENLYVLGRMHPGVNLALGTAFSEPVQPGVYTYEVRATSGLEVLGRVTIDTENRFVLPAPGPVQPVTPVEKAAPGTPEGELVPSAKGHLNVSLRWAVPDDLRRVGLLRTGFNVYRVDPPVAESEGWVLAAPPDGALATAVARETAGVSRINSLPILAGTPLTLAEAADPSDHTTIYAIDNNQRFRAGGVPFQNGDQFYYYVAASDLLARDGSYSLGTLVTICDRLPPAAPSAVQVENAFTFVAGVEKHVLKVRWQAPRPKEGESITRYFVYRWDSMEQMQIAQGNPAVNRVGVIAADDAGGGEFVDDGSMTLVADDKGQNLIHTTAVPGVPTAPADYGKTFWYTVRAVDNSACEGNLSGNSAPAFGVLRSRAFNGEAHAAVSIVSEHADVVGEGTSTVPVNAADTAVTYYYRAENALSANGILWTEFYLGSVADGPQRLLGRLRTEATGLQQALEGSLPRTELAVGAAFFCRVGLASGETAQGMLAVVDPKSVRVVYSYVSTYRQERSDAGTDTPPHVSIVGDGTFNPVRITLSFPTGSAEYKVYRRVDEGPLSMLSQGLVADDLTEVVEEDANLILHDGTVSYYAQLFDANGNPGPLELLRTLEMTGRSPVPPPRLLPLQPTGTPAAPRLRLRWFAPAPGIEQFLLFLAIHEDGNAYNGPEDLSPHLRFYSQDDFRYEALYVTGRIGVDFVATPFSTDIVVRDNSYFELEVPVVAGRKYIFSMQSCSLFGRISTTRSNVVEHTWQQTGGAGTGGVNGGDDGTGTVDDPALLPWPVRSLPNVLPADQAPERLGPLFLDQPYGRGVYVRIGEGPTQRKAGDPVFLRGDMDPATVVYTTRQNAPLLPFVLYRRQIASAAYPTPRRTVCQVSPLIAQLPHEYVAAQDRTFVRDRFFSMLFDGRYADTDNWQGLYLKDTQPVVRGARYEYVLVHFDPVSGEPRYSIVLPAVDIPDETP